MVVPQLVQTFSDALLSVFGGMWLVALFIMFIIFLGFMFIGVDFKFAMMLTFPLIPGFVAIGWFPQIVAGLFWIGIVTFGGWMIWSKIKEGN